MADASMPVRNTSGTLKGCGGGGGGDCGLAVMVVVTGDGCGSYHCEDCGVIVVVAVEVVAAAVVAMAVEVVLFSLCLL